MKMFHVKHKLERKFKRIDKFLENRFGIFDYILSRTNNGIKLEIEDEYNSLIYVLREFDFRHMTTFEIITDITNCWGENIS